MTTSIWENQRSNGTFYLEAYEVVHENDLPKIRAAMEKHLGDERIEALAFDYLYFYGNANTVVWSPGWYRSEVRVIRNTIPAWSSEALFFNVVTAHKKSRYPRATHTGARSEAQMNLKAAAVHKYWDEKPAAMVDYSKIDPAALKPFTGAHPKIVQDWLPRTEGIFQADPDYRLSKRETKHRLMLKLEKWLGVRFNKKHCQLVR